MRGIRSWHSKGEAANNLITDLHEGFIGGVKENTYMFVSSTRSKFPFPKFFAGFPQLFNHFFFSHALKRRFSLRHKLAKSVEMLHGAFSIGFFAFHKSSPLYRLTSITNKLKHKMSLLSKKEVYKNAYAVEF